MLLPVGNGETEIVLDGVTDGGQRDRGGNFEKHCNNIKIRLTKNNRA